MVVIIRQRVSVIDFKKFIYSCLNRNKVTNNQCEREKNTFKKINTFTHIIN